MGGKAERSPFGERLEDWILSRYESVADFCRQKQLDKNQVSRYLTGRNKPNMVFMEMIADDGADLTWIVSGRKPLTEIDPAAMFKTMRRLLNDLEEKTIKEDTPDADRDQS
jgi:transcriptional regulator with XRE-family HTH domain